jgi:hypothetical protein
MTFVEQFRQFCEARDTEERCNLDAFRAPDDTDFRRAALDATRRRLAAQWTVDDRLRVLDRLADRAAARIVGDGLVATFAPHEVIANA